MTKKFSYLEQIYTPIRQLGDKEKVTILRDITSVNRSDPNFCNYDGGNWNYKDFYEKAKEVGAGEIDIFLLNNDTKTEYMPCHNELFRLFKY